MVTILPAAISALESIFPFNDDIVIYSEGRQVFQNARPMKLSIKKEAKLMEHPLETGTTVVDHRVILPIEIQIAFILIAPFSKSTYQIIDNAYQAATILSIQTRAARFEKMIIASMPHDEDPETYDVLPLAVTFREARFIDTSVTPSTGGGGTRKPIKPANPSDNSKVERGQQDTSGDGRVYTWFN